MNAYEFLITESESPSLNGKVLVFAKDQRSAEAQLRDATFNGSRFVKWVLTKTTQLAAAAR